MGNSFDYTDDGYELKFYKSINVVNKKDLIILGIERIEKFIEFFSSLTFTDLLQIAYINKHLKNELKLEMHPHCVNNNNDFRLLKTFPKSKIIIDISTNSNNILTDLKSLSVFNYDEKNS